MVVILFGTFGNKKLSHQNKNDMKYSFEFCKLHNMQLMDTHLTHKVPPIYCYGTLMKYCFKDCSQSSSLRLAPVLKKIFINVSCHILVASLTLMALF